MTNVMCHWHVENIEKNITVSIGSENLVFKPGFWDFESIKKYLKTKSVDLETILGSNHCTVFHASEDVGLGDLGPYLGFGLSTTISSNTKTESTNSVNLFKGLTVIDIKTDLVNTYINLDQGSWSNLLVRLPIDTKQVLNQSITTYQPWSFSPCYNRLLTSIEFEVRDNSSLTNPYTLYIEIEVF